VSYSSRDIIFGSSIDVKATNQVKSLWEKARVTTDPIVKFDYLVKGWDRLSGEFFPNVEASGHRFKKLTGLCTGTARSRSIDELMSRVSSPIKDDLEPFAKDAERNFKKAERMLREHRKGRQPDHVLLESVGTLLWTVRSNSMHGRKTPSGPAEPTNRDEQICGLGAKVMEDLYKCAFPSW